MSQPVASARLDDAAWVGHVRGTLAGQDAELEARFRRKADIDALLGKRARNADALVRQAWERCLGDGDGLSLFAIGGYGRGVLYPHSDIDLLVLADEEAQARHAEDLARFVALLWDVGFPVGHAVRSLAQCTETCAGDLTALTALMEARPLQATDSQARALRQAIAPERIGPPREYFIGKRDEQRERHARFGNTSDNLEPNLKDGPGGLRDVETLRWIGQRVLGAADLQSLVGSGQLGADEYETLRRERRALAHLRWGLHTVARKREDRLRFDHQKALAEYLGHSDSDGSLAVEAMMQGFYRAAGLVRRINDRLLQRFEEVLEGEAPREPLADGYASQRGYLCATGPGWPRGVHDVLALFGIWAANPQLRGIDSYTAWALAEALPYIPAYPQASTGERAAFLALLRGPNAIKTVERMARLGVLGRWIPAFAQVTGRMQFDLFHAYTVDQHTLMVLANLRLFASGRTDERFSIAHEVWPRLRKPELLLLAGLFHDIGKGRGGDHSQLGAIDAQAFCTAHGLSAGDAETVTWLVREHLLMSTTAQKQDIGDPRVLHAFATRVGDRERLDLLYLLTCADIAGTSPKVWNGWKDRLLADLYTSARLALRRGLEHPLAAGERLADIRAEVRALLQGRGHADAAIDAALSRMPDGSVQRARVEQVAWLATALMTTRPDPAATEVHVREAGNGGIEVLVLTPDAPGLFAALVVTLDRLGLAVHRAAALDGPFGRVFDHFELLPHDSRRVPEPEAVRTALEQALAGPLDRIRPARRTQPAHMKHFRIAPQVEFQPSQDGRRTLMSLVCTDRVGLLADVATVLRDAGVRLHDARIITFGERAEDVFELTGAAGTMLDESAMQALRERLVASLEATA